PNPVDAGGPAPGRGPDDRAARRGGGAYRRARRSAPAVRLARAHLDGDPHRAHRVLRTERGLVAGARHAEPRGPGLRARGTVRVLPVVPGPRDPVGAAPSGR